MTRRRIAILAAGAVALVGAILLWNRSAAPSEPAIVDAGAPLSRARLRLRDLAKRPPARVSGRVTFADGKPAAGVLACVRAAGRDPRETVDDSDPRCVVTDSAGAYDFTELRPGGYVLWASAVGYGMTRWRGPQGDRVIVEAAEHLAGIDLVLARSGVELAGRVRDTRGRPVPGALVHVSVDRDVVFTTRSDARGEFHARGPAGKVTLGASADRFVDATLDAVAPTTGVELVMIPGASLSGVVVEGDARTPVADARVSVWGSSAISDDAGRFTIAKLEPGRYKPTATAIGRYGESSESVLVRFGAAVTGVTIELHPVAVVAGRVALEDGRGCPADAGGVSLLRRGSPAGGWGKTMDNGDVLLEGLVPGSYEVRVFCEGYLPAPPYPDLVVGNSDVEDVVWKVQPGARVTGRVRDHGGAPIAEAMVMYAAGGQYRSGGVRTSSDGTFAIDGVAPGVVTLFAEADGYVKSETVTVTAGPGNVPDAQLVVRRAGAIEATVVDAKGSPVKEAYVEVAGSGGGYTDDRGEIHLSSLEPATYEVSARMRWSERGDNAPKTTARVAVVAGETANVKLVVESYAGTLRGVVVDAAGAPLPDVAIDVAPSDPDSRRRDWQRTLAWTGADGTFEIGGLPDRKLVVRARLEGAEEAIVDGVELGDRVRIAMKPTGSLSGMVVDPSGASVDDVVLQVGDKAQELARSERLFHTRGKFTVRDLQAGTYRLMVDDDQQTAIVVPLADGEHKRDLVIRVRPRYSIRGRLVSADRRPLAGWNMELPHKETIDKSPNGRVIVTTILEQTISNAKGEFLFEGVIGVEVTISAGDRARDPEAEMIELQTVRLGASSARVIDLGDVVVPTKR